VGIHSFQGNLEEEERSKILLMRRDSRAVKYPVPAS